MEGGRAGGRRGRKGTRDKQEGGGGIRRRKCQRSSGRRGEREDWEGERENKERDKKEEFRKIKKLIAGA